MAQVFLLQNQHKQLLNKQGEWVDGREAASLYRGPHRDEALNQMVEANSRDYTLRIKILACELNARKIPIIADEDMPSLESIEAASSGESEMVTQLSEVECFSLFAPGAVSAI